MITEADIRELPFSEKLRVMEMVWQSLRQDKGGDVIPDWHEAELKATAARRASGLEEPIYWDAAKADLLKP